MPVISPMDKNNSIARRIAVFAGSVKLALILLWVVIAVSFAGALLPSGSQYLVYSSPFFYLLLGLFSLNLLCCCVNRIFFKRSGAGSAVTHSAVLIILAGCLVSMVSGFRGEIQLAEGDTSDSFVSGGLERALPFEITLEDFSVSWYPWDSGAYPVRVRIEDSGTKAGFNAVKGEEYRIGDTGYSFKVVSFFGHFALGEDRVPVNLSDQPLNPAALVRIDSPSGAEDRWIFSEHPDIIPGDDPNIRFRLDIKPHIKEFRSRVRVNDNRKGVSFVKDIKVNSPLSYGGYNIYQSRYDAENSSWSGFDVVYDPGVPVVFAGFLLLNAGIIMMFLPKLIGSFKNRTALSK